MEKEEEVSEVVEEEKDRDSVWDPWG